MSVSSNSRKESTDSYASQQMQNGGVMPGIDQLQKFNNPDNERVTTERIESDDTDFSDDMAEITDSVAQPTGVHVDDADWNTTTEDDDMAPTRADAPDRTLGNS